LPQQFGTIRKITVGSRQKAVGSNQTSPIVIQVQDVHQNAEAQNNIAQIVGRLAPIASVVGLEGTTETIDLSSFRSFPDQEAVKAAADFLLKENKISGPIHAAMTAAKECREAPDDFPAVVGIDDGQHYAANVEAYKLSAPKQAHLKTRVKSEELSVQGEKQKAFNQELLEFDARVQSYRGHAVALGDHIRFLAKGRQPLPPQTALFLEALRMEKDLDFSRVEKERAELIKGLVEGLTPFQIQELTRHSMSYRAGSTSHADFYRYLKSVAKESQRKPKESHGKQ